MTEVLKFMADNPWLAGFIVIVIASTITTIMVNLPNRILRHWNIRLHGYPPPNCDADGDFRPKDE